MATRRMFSLKIVDTDAFLEMPMSSQLLYFHLSMRADDEGFVGSPKRIMRLIGVNEDDLKVLTSKRFILSFKSGIVVIKHWLIHNVIRMDRLQKTLYQKEKETLVLNEYDAYTEDCQPNVNQTATKCPPKLSKVKLSKVKLSKDSIAETSSAIIPELVNDKQHHIKIIGLFARAKKTNFKSKEQQKAFIKRNLRPAKNLSAYKLEDIIETIYYLINNADFKWTLETVGKYIDEDLTALNNKTVKI